MWEILPPYYIVGKIVYWARCFLWAWEPKDFETMQEFELFPMIFLRERVQLFENGTKLVDYKYPKKLQNLELIYEFSKKLLLSILQKWFIQRQKN